MKNDKNDIVIRANSDRHFEWAGRLEFSLFSAVIAEIKFVILRKKKPPDNGLEDAADKLKEAAKALEDSSKHLKNIEVQYDPELKEAIERAIDNLTGYKKWKR